MYHSSEIFYWDGSSISQITMSATGESSFPSLDGGEIAFWSDADLTGGNADGTREIFLASPASSVLAIPTAGLGGLLTLVIMLSLAGWACLRRPLA